MTGFKKFLGVYTLFVLVPICVFAVGSELLRSEGGLEAEQNHFSVQWMGFAPTDYSSEYPEYYICINNLKDDPLTMQIALQIKNQEDSPYYFKVDQFAVPPSGWSILPMAVGLVHVDETKQFVYDNVFRSRPTSIPAGRLTESINLVVQAYNDAGYTNLYSQDDFTVTFNFLDVMSAEWTILYHANFDDGQTHDWTTNREGGYSYGASVAVSDIYYRSFQYSLRLDTHTGGDSRSWCRAAYRKSFDIGLASEVYLIYSIRSENWDAHNTHGVRVDGTTYFKSDVTPRANIWYQFAVKLKPAQLNNVEIWTAYVSGYGNHRYSYLDDVYVIAK